MYPYDDTKDDYAANSNEALKRLVDDPLYWREQDPEYRSYVDDSFKTVYGGEAAEQDATGRIVEADVSGELQRSSRRSQKAGQDTILPVRRNG